MMLASDNHSLLCYIPVFIFYFTCYNIFGFLLLTLSPHPGFGKLILSTRSNSSFCFALTIKLPTKNCLHHIDISPNPHCPICKTDNEYIEHIFLRCCIAKKCWLNIGLNFSTLPITTNNNWIYTL